jgi:ssDNA-binding Zn-finger/Zn-ribbon topoisomerase 1
MMGLGEKCPACGAIMKAEQRRRLSSQQQEAVLRCLGCRRLWHVDLHFSPVRAYKHLKTEGETSEKETEATCVLIDERIKYPDELCFFGDLCPKCGSFFRVRTSRRISEYFKVFYLNCTAPNCEVRFKVDLSILEPGN